MRSIVLSLLLLPFVALRSNFVGQYRRRTNHAVSNNHEYGPGAVGWRQSHEVVAAAGFTVALLSFFLLQDPGKGYGGGVGEIAAVSQSNDAGQQRSAVSLPDAKNSVAAVKAMVGEIAAGAAAAGAGETEEEERGEGVAAEAARLLIGGGDGKGGKEDRESFREALGIVFESDTVKLVRSVFVRW